VSQAAILPDATWVPEQGSSSTLVVLPTYNERENLERAVRAVREVGYDVLVVDDSSPDGTADLAVRMAETDPGVHLMVRPGKLGLGSAYVEGFRCGLAQGYEYLADIVETAQRTRALVLGSRYIRGGSVSGWGWNRKLLSACANVYCRALLGLHVRDATTGYRCYPRSVLEAIGLDRIMSQGYSFQIEMVYRCVRQGFVVHEVPIHFEDRVAGRSKVSEGEVRKALLAVLMLRLRGV